jgi:hypothetical protein
MSRGYFIQNMCTPSAGLDEEPLTGLGLGPPQHPPEAKPPGVGPPDPLTQVAVPGDVLHLQDSDRHYMAENSRKWKTAGPRITTKMAGKTKRTRGMRIFTVTLAASSSAACCRLSPELLGVDPEGVGDRGPEPVRLDEHTHQGPDIADTGAFSQVPEGLFPGRSGPDLQAHQGELVSQGLADPGHLVADPDQGLVQPQPGLHADHHEVQGIGEGRLDLVLSGPDPPPKDHVGEHPAHQDGPGHHQDPHDELGADEADQDEGSEAHPQCRHGPKPDEDGRRRRRAITGLDQLMPEAAPLDLLLAHPGTHRLQEPLKLLPALLSFPALPDLVLLPLSGRYGGQPLLEGSGLTGDHHLAHTQDHQGHREGNEEDDEIDHVVSSDLDVGESSDDHEADDHHDEGHQEHAPARRLHDQGLHVVRIHQVQEEPGHDGCQGDDRPRHAAVSRVDLHLPPELEAGPDDLGEAAELLGQVPAGLLLDQDGGDEEAHVHQVHPVRQALEGLVQGKTEPGLLVDLAELGPDRLLGLLGHHLHAGGEGMTGPDGPGQEIQGVGKGLLEGRHTLGPLPGHVEPGDEESQSARNHGRTSCRP